MNDLLFEIGTEEIPAGFLNPAAEQLQLLFEAKAEKRNISFESIKTFSTPRRLALLVCNLAERQRDSLEISLGPSSAAAFDADGKPTRAAEGFARSKGVTVAELSVVETLKGEYLQLTREVKGQSSSALLPGLLQELILELSFPKSMKWGSYHNTFARPVQWLVALLGDTVIELEFEGVPSGRLTKGHRFMASGEKEIARASEYEAVMESVSVIADFT
ncbi:MAG: glycine--tRNA ligase subunit beta, partial [Desulfocapsaceae bacterium]|nr:glycine--tRNA ligase subunit beta [Desulfocapsaceae bacterium]